MDFKDLSPNEIDCVRLDFLIDKCFDELQSSYFELSIESKSLLLQKLSCLVVEFSTLFYGGC